MTTLDGAHVLVTGGSEGIGLETARLLLTCGARVTVLSRSADKLAAAAVEVPGLRTVSCDVTDEEALSAAVAALDPVDVLIAAAGGAEPGHFLELSCDSLRRQLEVNYLGSLHAVRAVLPGMLERGQGHVVLVSSVAALCGVFGYGGYSPAKAALVNLAEVLEAEYAHRGLTVSVLFPPDTITPGFERENLTKPAETAAVSAMVKPLPAAVVARALVHGIERNRRTITADPASALLARATSVLAPVVRLSMRRTVRKTRR